jgi:UrcA family protein
MKAHIKNPARVIFLSLAPLAAAAAMLTFVDQRQVAPPERLAVSYADLDVNTADGAAVLFHRIRVAAGEVCSIYDGKNPAQAALRESCTDRAVTQAVAVVDKPLLSDRYLSEFHQQKNRELVASR